MLFEIPSIPTHIFNAELRLPMQKFLRFFRIGPVGGNVARAARADLVGQLMTAGLFEGMNHVENAVARAGAEVDGIPPRRRGGAFHGADVTLGEIDDVNVVAHAGAVGRVVVVAENLDGGEAPGGDARDVGEKVIRNAVRVFADKP